jgi:amino acid adenylation domain-containing protein
LGLQLNYNVKEGTGEIVSCSHVPETHLVQLEAELRKTLSAISEEMSLLNRSHKQREWPVIGLSVLNENPLKLPGPDLLHKLISNPDFSNRIAIEYEGNEDVIESLSYSEVENQCAILAARICVSLRSSNHSTQPIIPILLPQSPQLYIAMIAISRTGCAFCPLPLDGPPDRLRFILQDLSATVVVTNSVYEDRLGMSPNISTIMLDDKSSEERKEPAEMPTSIAFNSSSTDVAYVMYTSGSTGQPKGVPVSNLSVTQSLLAHDRHIPAFDRFLQFASPTFDVSMFEIFFTFYRGSTLICCERSRLLGDLPSAMRRLKVDACELTPTVAAGLLQRRSNVPSLKLLLTIGEMLTPAVVQEFGGDESRESILWGMYGPTEAAIHCTLQPAFSSKSIVGNIGVPLDTVSAYIIAPHQVSDRKGHVDVLPLGHVGELAVGGFQLANGYLNRLEQTSEAFIETEQYGRLYRTGDRARMLPDGSIECLGRISSGQVKLRGQRIELGEIQHAATRAKGCFDAVASIVRGNLVVFCLGDNSVTADAVLATCREWLPAFMVPGDAVVLTDYPRLSSGKVDRKQLERDYDTRTSDNDDEVDYAPSSELNQIRNILEQVLGHPVNGKSSLTQMGLDSLSAIKAASALRRKGIEMTPFQLLDATNLQQLASRSINSGAPQATSTATERVGAEGQLVALIPEILHPMRSEIEEVIICTPLQTSMLAETMKDARAYCNWVELQLGPEWSVSKITEWLEMLAGNNAILRSGFCQLDSIKHPFGLIRWKHLLKDQITEVKELTRSASLQDDTDYLRPVQFQIRKESSFTTLLVRLHHSLYDGWTLDLLLNDIDDLILEKPLRQRPQFDLVAAYYWSLDTSSSRQYWQDHLHEYQPISMPNYNGHIVTNPTTQCHRFHFTSSLRKLRAWAMNLGVGSQTIFQAALTYILSRYLGTSDVVIGTVTSGRTIPVDGIEHIMGPCLSTLPLRVNVAHSKRLSDLVKDINLCNRRMLEHGTETLQSIKHGCGVKTTESLWDVLFIWQETLETRTAQSRCIKIVDSFDRLECPMTLEVEPRSDEIIGKATYHSSVFPKEQVVLFFEQMDALVEHFISSTDLLLDNIGSCFPTSVRSVANPSPEALKCDHGLTAMVESHARSRPNDTALIFAKTVDDVSKPFETLTYQQLNERANRLGRFLTENVNVASELICICMEKSLDLYVAILAVLKTGRGYLPITPSTPRERIQTIMKKASTLVCLSHSQTSAGLGLYEFCSVINLDTADTSSTAEHDLNIAYKGSNIAYAVFTSGSTGTPKGVLVTQQNLLSNLESLSRIYPISAGGRLLQACSQAFDVSVFEVFFSWYTGMCLCSATNDVLFSDIEQCIRRLEITHLSLTPTVAALICPQNVPKVKFLVTAGEAVTEKVMKTWADKGLYQGYGPSETTNICTVKPNVSTLDLINNIGPPLLNTSAFVMNPNSNEILPSGAVGELCFGGDQVFRGYLDQPKLSLEKIIDHPEYGRLYRSGDTGRLLPGGDILFSGRTDDQVKIRGQRVELGEINRRVLNRSDISDCTTFVMGDRQSRTERLVTFWVPQGLQSLAFSVLDVSEITRISAIIRSIFLDLSSVLPHYMMPTTLVPITLIPTTVQGKVDKKALTSCYHSLENEKLDACGIAIGGLEDVGAWSKVEVLVAQALSRVLNIHIRDVERHSSFFRLGLDSISAIRFAKLLRDTLNHPVSVSTILQNPSAVRLAVQLEHMETPVLLDVDNSGKIFMNDVKSSIEAKARKAGLAISEIRPCTPLQEAMLSLGISSNISSSYCNTMLFQIKIDVEVLERCWNAMTWRHEILRTYFVSTDDSAYPFAQVVLSQHNPKWISRQGVNTSDLVENANEIALSELPAAVNSLQPPYFLNILRRTSGCYLQFSCHHALHDGTAIHILLGEVEKAVRGEELPDPVSFEPFLQEMVRHRSSEAIAFWQERLKDLRPTLLQSNDRVPAVHSQELDISLSALEQSCQELGVSMLSASQSAWAKTMQSLVRDVDVCFGNVVSGRTLSIDGLDKLVAPTFNTVPVRANMIKTKTNLELLRNLQKNNADLLPYQLTPLRSIQSKLGFGGSGIFSTMLLFQQEKFELDSSIWALAEEFGEMNVSMTFATWLEVNC